MHFCILREPTEFSYLSWKIYKEKLFYNFLNKMMIYYRNNENILVIIKFEPNASHIHVHTHPGQNFVRYYDYFCCIKISRSRPLTKNIWKKSKHCCAFFHIVVIRAIIHGIPWLTEFRRSRKAELFLSLGSLTNVQKPRKNSRKRAVQQFPWVTEKVRSNGFL